MKKKHDLMSGQETVVVLGASDKSDRYSNKAIKMLMEYGHRVIPIHPRLDEIESLEVKPDLKAVDTPVDTLTMYVGPKRSLAMIDDILALKPKRVILNPGTESSELEKALDKAHIPYLEACTLVMLRTGQY
jgi:hypothetical protein